MLGRRRAVSEDAVQFLAPQGKVGKTHAGRGVRFGSEENYEFLPPRTLQPSIRPKTHNDPTKLQASYRKTQQRLQALRTGTLKPPPGALQGGPAMPEGLPRVETAERPAMAFVRC